MDFDETHIVALIEGASKKSGLAPATICGRGVGNTRLYARLKAGGSCSFSTFRRLKEFVDTLSDEKDVA